MKDKIIIGAVILALVVSLVAIMRPNDVTRVAEQIVGAAAGPEHTERQFFKDGVVISSSTSAARITLFDCTTASYTLGALQERGAPTSSASVASTSITLSGATTDSVVEASFATTSVPNVNVSGKVQSANTITVFFENLGATNITARTASATVTACIVDPN